MDELHDKLICDENFVPNEGQRDLLCSNKESHRCPSFGLNNNISEDVALDYLAKVLVEAFLDKKEYEYNQFHKSKTGSSICPSINEGTG